MYICTIPCKKIPPPPSPLQFLHLELINQKNLLELLTILAPPRGKNRMSISYREPVELDFPGLKNAIFSKIENSRKKRGKFSKRLPFKGARGGWSRPFQASLPEYVVRAQG